jgi:poly(A) polymerase
VGWLTDKISNLVSLSRTRTHGRDRRLFPQEIPEPIVIPRDRHPISRRNIDPDALKVMYRLANHGYQAYLVGGGVRDLLLGRKPKDFDVGTDAQPKEIRRLFGNSMIIGRRFRIVHVRFRDNKIIEVTTFRKEGEQDESRVGLPMLRDNTFGTPGEDAFRRDLTINGLFYNIKDFTIIDYVGGLDDLNARIIRIIGDPRVRIMEDPVRIIRAVRHAARTGFTIEEKTDAAIRELVGRLAGCPPARIHEELIKELKAGHSQDTLRYFKEYGILGVLFPEIERIIERHHITGERFFTCLGLLDALTRSGAEFPTAFLFSVPMIPLAMTVADKAAGSPDKETQDVPRLIQGFLSGSLSRVGVSKHNIDTMRHLLFRCWKMFSMIDRGHIPASYKAKRYFAEAFDLLSIAAKAYGRFPDAPWPPGPEGLEGLARLMQPPQQRRRPRRRGRNRTRAEARA